MIHFRSILFLLCLLTRVIPAPLQLVLHSGEESILKDTILNGIQYVDAHSLIKSFISNEEFSFIEKRITYTLNEKSLTFVDGLNLFQIEEAHYRLKHPVHFRQGYVFLPLAAFLPHLGKLLGLGVTRDSMRITLYDKAPNILDIYVEHKQSTSLVHILTTKPLGFRQTQDSLFTLIVKQGRFKKHIDNLKPQSGPIQGIKLIQFPHYAVLKVKVKEASISVIGYQGEITLVVSKKDTSKIGSRKNAFRLKTVVIDAGHGGHDPGTISYKGVKEKTVVLTLALKLKERLSQMGFNVLMTRDNDVYIKLRDRTRYANHHKADLFVSLHANSIGGSQRRKKRVHGFVCYFLSEAKNDEDRSIAVRENRSIKLESASTGKEGDDDLSWIVSTVVTNQFLEESQMLAKIISKEMGSGQRQVRRKGTGVSQAGFFVLDGATMPAVLFEIGYLSNPNESYVIKSAKWQSNCALILAQAIQKFKSIYEPKR